MAMPPKTQDEIWRDHASTEQPRPQDGASRERTPTGQSPTERTPTNPPALAQYNLAQARMHKTARNLIVIKGNAMAIANAPRLEGCRASERVAKQRRLPAL